MAITGMRTAALTTPSVGVGNGPEAHSAQNGPSWREQAGVVAFASVAIAVVLAWASTRQSSLGNQNDFRREVWPAYTALLHGHLLGFIRIGPPYVGSLILRAPFAVVPAIWGGGAQATYFASALPCLIAAPLLGVWLAARFRREGKGTAVQVGAIVLSIFNPLVLVTVFGGHPEEVLGGVLCVAGLVLAADGESGWAGFLIGLAIVNKAWAVAAVPVALAVMPRGRGRGLLVMAVTVGVVMIPVELARMTGGPGVPGLGGGDSQLASQTGTIFNPPQILWWFGRHSWIVAHARPVIVMAAVLVSVVWWWLRRADTLERSDRVSQALLLLALVFFLRAALDPWDNIYYHVPFLFALMAYEVHERRRPWLTGLYTVALVVVAPVGGVPPMAHDVQAAVYAVFALVTIAWIGTKLIRPGSVRRPLRGPITPARRSTADVTVR
jgi:hypothetical protein